VFCKTFLENVLRDPVSGEIGKSIIFAVSQHHAAKLVQILNVMADKMFPGKYRSWTIASPPHKSTILARHRKSRVPWNITEVAELVSSGRQGSYDCTSSYRQCILQKRNCKVRHLAIESLTNVVSRDSPRKRP